MATLSLRHIHKSFGKIPIIKNFNFEAQSGEFVVLVGPSGCGKSTLLRMIAGLEDITDGEILVNDQLINEQDPSVREIAMVFQSYALYPHMSAYENMEFSLKMEKKLDRAAIEERVKEAARILRLTEVLQQKPKELSGGQKQRVAIGRAFVRQPKIFLFDEPLSNLDAELRVEMRLEIAKLREAVQATMVYVTHDQTEAMTLADRIVVLRSGHIEQVGTPSELYLRPNNQFVAGFIGSPKMNFFPAKLTSVQPSSDGKGLTYTVSIRPEASSAQSSSFPLSISASRLNDLGRTAAKVGENLPSDVMLGCRPEDIFVGDSLTEESSGNKSLNITDDHIAITSELEVDEYLGSLSYLYVTNPFLSTTKGPETLKQNTIIVKTEEHRSFQRHKPLTLKFPLEKLHLFDANGEALL